MKRERAVIYCPNASCGHHLAARGARFYKYAGYFRTRYNHQPVPRYRCRECGKYFSSHTFRHTYRQTRPDLNRSIFELLCSGVTQRRIAKLLRCDRKTVARKLLFLSQYFGEMHFQEVRKGNLQFAQAQFDEMESFEHTRLKPLTIALAVSGNGEKILGAKVAPIVYKGRLAKLAFKKYGKREDKGAEARSSVLESVATCLAKAPIAVVTSDAKPSYRPAIGHAFGGKAVIHRAFANRQNQLRYATHPLRRRNVADPLFYLNHVSARIRHDLSRMMRKVWNTTKLARYLQAHLNLFMAYYNEYPLPR